MGLRKTVMLSVTLNILANTLDSGEGKITTLPLPPYLYQCFDRLTRDVQDMSAEHLCSTCILNYLWKVIGVKCGDTPDTTLKYMGRLMRPLLSTRNKRQATTRRRPLPVRKEYRMMTDEERQNFHTAILLLKNDMSIPPNAYDALALFHQYTVGMSAHGGPNFLGWHRIFLLILEFALREKIHSVTIPYWDSRLDHHMDNPVDSIIWWTQFLGNGDGAVRTGPFANWFTPMGQLTRNIGSIGQLISRSDVRRILRERNTIHMVRSLEMIHNSVHVWVGGHMLRIDSAAMDPVFFMHHAFIDYIWWVFQYIVRTRDVWQYPETDLRHQQANAEMDNLSLKGFRRLRNRDGYRQKWTRDFYTYDPAPSCSWWAPSCRSKYLICALWDWPPYCISVRAPSEIAQTPSGHRTETVIDTGFGESKQDTETATGTGSEGSKADIGTATETGSEGSKADIGTATDTGSEGSKADIGTATDTGTEGSKADIGTAADTGSVGSKADIGTATDTGSGGSKPDTETTTDTGSGGSRANTKTTTDTGSGGSRAEIGTVTDTGSGGSKADPETATETGSEGSKADTETATETGSEGSRADTETATENGSGGSKLDTETATDTGFGGSKADTETATENGSRGSKADTETATDRGSGGSRTETARVIGSGGSTEETERTLDKGSGRSRVGTETAKDTGSGGSKADTGTATDTGSGGSKADEKTATDTGSKGSRANIGIATDIGSGVSKTDEETATDTGSRGSKADTNKATDTGSEELRVETETTADTGSEGSRADTETATDTVSGGSKTDTETATGTGSEGSKADIGTATETGSGETKTDTETATDTGFGGLRADTNKATDIGSGGSMEATKEETDRGSGGSRTDTETATDTGSGGSSAIAATNTGPGRSKTDKETATNTGFVGSKADKETATNTGSDGSRENGETTKDKGSERSKGKTEKTTDSGSGESRENTETITNAEFGKSRADTETDTGSVGSNADTKTATDKGSGGSKENRETVRRRRSVVKSDLADKVIQYGTTNSETTVKQTADLSQKAKDATSILMDNSSNTSTPAQVSAGTPVGKDSQSDSGHQQKHTHTSCLGSSIQNLFMVNCVSDVNLWVYLLVKVIHLREQGPIYHSSVVKNGTIDPESDIYHEENYPKLNRYVKPENPSKKEKCAFDNSGVFKVTITSYGLNYLGWYEDYVFVDNRHPIAAAVGYIAVKKPEPNITEVYLTAFDHCGRICRPKCLIPYSNPPLYKSCSGALRLDHSYPKMYGDTYGEAVLRYWNFYQGDECPTANEDQIFIVFYCDYVTKWWPWNGREHEGYFTKR